MTTGGAAAVVKLWSGPSVVPLSFPAAARKWYVEFGVRLERINEIGTGADAVPTTIFGVTLSYSIDVPQSKCATAALAVVSTDPFKLADVVVIDEAGFVVTDGAWPYAVRTEIRKSVTVNPVRRCFEW